jgi:hypothetical protein
VSDTIYTRTLARAAQAEGSTSALAQVLRVPERTLERWMSGRAQMPVRAFVQALERLTQHENNGAPAPVFDSDATLTFPMGELLARCGRCDGTEFTPALPGAPLKMTSELACRACGEKVVHGNLIARLAEEVVQHSRAATIARNRRQKALPQRKPEASR